MALDADLVALFRCPACHGALAESRDPAGFGCAACGLLYAVEDDLPSFLAEEAKPWPVDEAMPRPVDEAMPRRAPPADEAP